MKIKGFKILAVPVILTIVLATGAAASAQVTNWVQNPEFTPNTLLPSCGLCYAYAAPGTGDFIVPDWTFSPLINYASGSGIAGQGSNFGFAAPPSGAPQVAFVQLGTALDPASVSQTITGLTVNNVYDLTFYLEGRLSTGAPATTVSIGVGDTVLAGVVPPTVWTFYNYDFTATSTSETLEFSSLQTQDTTTAIDDPSITLVPEGGASLLYLLLAGITCFGTMRLSTRTA